MILSTSEIEKRLASPNNLSNLLKRDDNPRSDSCFPLANPPEILPIKTTRQTGDTAKLPSPIRDLIAITAAGSEESNQSVADAFGTSQNTISLMRRGLTGYRRDGKLGDVLDAGEAIKKEREEKIQEKRDNTHELALDNLMACLSAIKPRLEGAEPIKLVNLGQLATSMSKVASNLDKKRDEEVEAANRPKIVLFAPTLKTENFYETIESS